MKIRLNGKDYKVKGATTVGGLLRELEIVPERVAVEVNLKIVKKAEYDTFPIKEGDVVEVVSFVGGGLATIDIKRRGPWKTNSL